MFAAIEADFVSLLLQSEGARQVFMAATQNNFIEEIEDDPQQIHKIGPRPLLHRDRNIEQ
ncbi:MAG: hypothetical protein WA426_18315 [Silvibacterium sp.]